MNSRRIALPLAVAVHILLLYALSKSGGHLFRLKDSSKPLSVTMILAPPRRVEAIRAKPQDVRPAQAPKPALAANNGVPTPVAPTSAPATVLGVAQAKESAALPPIATTTGGISLTQSALNAIGKMDQDERRHARAGANVMSNSLEARLSGAIDKYAPVKAGTIDENVYPDGRREERIHSIFGVYCITYESPSDPKDGFDTMQRGLKPSVPHSCGHRFD
jgi:hypothetical protein